MPEPTDAQVKLAVQAMLARYPIAARPAIRDLMHEIVVLSKETGMDAIPVTYLAYFVEVLDSLRVLPQDPGRLK